jgi:hypothetical protein
VFRTEERKGEVVTSTRRPPGSQPETLLARVGDIGASDQFVFPQTMTYDVAEYYASREREEPPYVRPKHADLWLGILVILGVAFITEGIFWIAGVVE